MDNFIRPFINRIYEFLRQLTQLVGPFPRQIIRNPINDIHEPFSRYLPNSFDKPKLKELSKYNIYCNRRRFPLRDDPSRLLQSNPRYTYEFLPGRRCCLKLIDLFTGDERHFYKDNENFCPLTCELIREIRLIKAYPKGLMLIYYVTTNSMTTHFALIRLNFDIDEWVFINMWTSEFRLINCCLMDGEDENRFAIVSVNNEIFVLGMVVENQIHIEWQNKFMIRKEIECKKLHGNHVFGIMSIVLHSQALMRFWKMDIRRIQGYVRFNFESPNRSGRWSFELENCNYSWTNDNICCYVMPDLPKISDQRCLYAFNVLNHQCTQIILPGLKLEQNLIGTTDNNRLVVRNGQFYNLYPMRKPEKLQKLAWFEIRRSQMACYNRENMHTWWKIRMRLKLGKELKPFYGLVD